VLRSEYLRSAWQAYDDNAVRLSLDEHMLLLRETPQPPPACHTNSGSNGGGNGSWCSPMESLPQIPAADAVRFPYAILEIKLQDKEGAPAWVHELMASGVLVEVPKFSKFLHGMALLRPEGIREVPSWFLWREGVGVALPASLDEMWEFTAERRERQELEWQVGGLERVGGMVCVEGDSRGGKGEGMQAFSWKGGGVTRAGVVGGWVVEGGGCSRGGRGNRGVQRCRHCHRR